MNVVEQILKKELNLLNDMCDRFHELAKTKYLKKKEMAVCYVPILRKMLLSSLKTFTFPVQLSSLTEVSLLVNLVSGVYRL